MEPAWHDFDEWAECVWVDYCLSESPEECEACGVPYPAYLEQAVAEDWRRLLCEG